MRLLLDTHAFLWSITGGPVSEQARIAFLNNENELFLSAVSYWEISIKVSLGKLLLADGWQETFEQEMLINQIKWLPIEKKHCHAVLTLPFHHGDPFDRMLIAQALCEEMTLMTVDTNIKRYTVQTLW